MQQGQGPERLGRKPLKALTAENATLKLLAESLLATEVTRDAMQNKWRLYQHVGWWCGTWWSAGCVSAALGAWSG